MSNPKPTSTTSATLGKPEAARIMAMFSKYVNAGQVKYLRAGHLDVLEHDRSGAQFTDPITGRRMFDCFTSAGCFNVSRHNPVVLAALEAALDGPEALDMGSYHLVSRAKRDLAAKLADLAPGDLNGVLLAAGGGDAVDCAIKLARGATGRVEVISTIKAYHGHTGFALSANGKAHYREYCEPLMPGFSFVPFNDLAAMRRQVSGETAAVILEPVQGEAGIFPATEAYLRGLRELCDTYGAALIFDEIQTGFGRTGRLFASEHSGVVPDIMTVAKSIGGGLYPNAAVLYRETPTLTAFLDDHPDFHVSYAGGTDLGCRVSLRVLEYIEENRLWENAAAKGRRLQEALRELQRENPNIIREVRGLGLMVGLEYVHEFMGPMMADALAEQSVFAAYSGNAPQVMRFMPPITLTDAELDGIIAAIRGALRKMKTLLPLALVAARVPGVLGLLNDERVQTWVFGLLRRIEDATRRKSS